MRHEQEGSSLGYGIVNTHQCNEEEVPIKGTQAEAAEPSH